jgi:hypothetical protein
MKKEIGKWLMDVGKYVATAVLITTFLGGLQQKWLMYIISILLVVGFVSFGLLFINSKNIKKK